MDGAGFPYLVDVRNGDKHQELVICITAPAVNIGFRGVNGENDASETAAEGAVFGNPMLLRFVDHGI